MPSLKCNRTSVSTLSIPWNLTVGGEEGLGVGVCVLRQFVMAHVCDLRQYVTSYCNMFKHIIKTFVVCLDAIYAEQQCLHGFLRSCAGIFSGSSHTSDLEIGSPVAILLGAWCYRVSAATGWPGVSIL